MNAGPEDEAPEDDAPEDEAGDDAAERAALSALLDEWTSEDDAAAYDDL